jgi:hypothetical protein
VAKLLASNAFVIVVLFVLEKGWGFKFEESKRVIYDRVELVAPDRHEELLADLKARTGLAITAIEVRRLDLLRDVAELKISYSD